MSRRTTIKDIAKAAGVSAKTVSRVLNDEKHVAADVRDRVKALADELNYHPNVNAQGLISRRTYLIGLNYERPGPSYVVELQHGTLQRLEHERYRMVVLPFSDADARQAELVAFLRTAALDGVVLAPPASDLLPVLDALDRAAIPYARIAPWQAPGRGVCSLMDDVAASRELAGHILDLGHRRIAVILGDATHHSSEARLEGTRQAFAARGLDFAGVRLEQGDFTYPSGDAAMRRILESGSRPTAVIAQNDDMAAAGIMVARDFGLDVPGDISIAGFDDSDLSRLTWPRVTTVRQPVREMAEAAVDGLLKVLEGEAPPPPVIHPHELLIRQSTAPPRT